MTETQKFYNWWIYRVKGNYINNKTLERISNKLDYKPLKPLRNDTI